MREGEKVFTSREPSWENLIHHCAIERSEKPLSLTTKRGASDRAASERVYVESGYHPPEKSLLLVGGEDGAGRGLWGEEVATLTLGATTGGRTLWGSPGVE